MGSILREHRLIKYKSNLGRFGGTFGRYDYKDPIQWFAAAGHGASQLAGADPAIKDVGRMIDGNKSELPAYGSFFGRTIANVREFFDGAENRQTVNNQTLFDRVVVDKTHYFILSDRHTMDFTQQGFADVACTYDEKSPQSFSLYGSKLVVVEPYKHSQPRQEQNGTEQIRHEDALANSLQTGPDAASRVDTQGNRPQGHDGQCAYKRRSYDAGKVRNADISPPSAILLEKAEYDEFYRNECTKQPRIPLDEPVAELHVVGQQERQKQRQRKNYDMGQDNERLAKL